MSAFDPADGGWASKKLHFGLLSVALIFIGWLMSARWPALQPMFTTMVGGITGVYALFAGADIGSKWVIGNNVVKAGQPIPVADPGPRGSADV